MSDAKKSREFEVEINYTDGAVIGWREVYRAEGDSALISKQKADIMAKQEMRARGLDPDDMKAIDKVEETAQKNAGLVLYYENNPNLWEMQNYKFGHNSMRKVWSASRFFSACHLRTWIGSMLRITPPP